MYFSWKVLFYLLWVINGAEQILKMLSMRFLNKKTLTCVLVQPHIETVLQIFCFNPANPKPPNLVWSTNIIFCPAWKAVGVYHRALQSLSDSSATCSFPSSFSIGFKWACILFAFQVNTSENKLCGILFKVCSSSCWKLGYADYAEQKIPQNFPVDNIIFSHRFVPFLVFYK